MEGRLRATATEGCISWNKNYRQSWALKWAMGTKPGSSMESRDNRDYVKDIRLMGNNSKAFLCQSRDVDKQLARTEHAECPRWLPVSMSSSKCMAHPIPALCCLYLFVLIFHHPQASIWGPALRLQLSSVGGVRALNHTLSFQSLCKQTVHGNLSEFFLFPPCFLHIDPSEISLPFSLPFPWYQVYTRKTHWTNPSLSSSPLVYRLLTYFKYLSQCLRQIKDVCKTSP